MNSLVLGFVNFSVRVSATGSRHADSQASSCISSRCSNQLAPGTHTLFPPAGRKSFLPLTQRPVWTSSACKPTCCSCRSASCSYDPFPESQAKPQRPTSQSAPSSVRPFSGTSTIGQSAPSAAQRSSDQSEPSSVRPFSVTSSVDRSAASAAQRPTDQSATSSVRPFRLSSSIRQSAAAGAAVAAAFLLTWGGLTPPPHAWAVNRPEFLPSEPTPVIDLAEVFPRRDEERLKSELTRFEQETGWKLRVIASYPDRTPGLAVKEFWGLPDPRSVVVLANPSAGNILNFSVGDDVYAKIPRAFWLELQSRFGNKFTVKDMGENKAIEGAVGAIEECLVRPQGCTVVPGIPQDQYNLTLICAVAGGIIAGIAAKTGQREGGEKTFSWTWLAIFSPLWGILFGAFGIAPVITRTSDIVPIGSNVAAFVAALLFGFWLPIFQAGPPRESDL